MPKIVCHLRRNDREHVHTRTNANDRGCDWRFSRACSDNYLIRRLRKVLPVRARYACRGARYPRAIRSSGDQMTNQGRTLLAHVGCGAVARTLMMAAFRPQAGRGSFLGCTVWTHSWKQLSGTLKTHQP